MAGYVDESSEKPNSEFKKAFKYFRHASTNDQFYELIDFDHPQCFNVDQKNLESSISIDSISKMDFETLHLHWPPTEWTAYEIPRKPGFLFLKNPFSTLLGHRYWTRRCLLDYARWPNVTNIDGLLDQKYGDRRKDVSIFDDKQLLKKLRWVTLGYHHDWNTKVYDHQNRSSIPDDLYRLSSMVAKVLFGDNIDFRTEAVIVNFYRMNSTLAGHVDHSEWNLDLPLFSFSFGQSAIFLLGGRTLDEKPIAVKIKSGDVVVMSGECRLAYHGVPRILKDDNRINEDGSDEDLVEISKYLSENRINMNVRQVN